MKAKPHFLNTPRRALVRAFSWKAEDPALIDWADETPEMESVGTPVADAFETRPVEMMILGFAAFFLLRLLLQVSAT
jgi:hypothetical protein